MTVKPPRPRLPALNALRAFEAAARCESFVKAAEELGVTPGAVTQQIRQLEAWLGFPVFMRMPQRIVATQAAREALPKLTRGFDMLSQAVQTLRDSHADRALTVAALPCVAQLWVSPRLADLRRAFPGLQVSVSAMEQPPDPRRDPHDLALFYLEAAGKADARMAFEADTILPVCSPGLAQNLKTPADLARETLLHDGVWRDDWRRWLGHVGATGVVDASRGPTFSLYSLALDAALSGSGVLMGRTSLIARHLADGRLVAPFGITMPTKDRLTLLTAPPGRAHPGQDAIVEWLLASA